MKKIVGLFILCCTGFISSGQVNDPSKGLDNYFGGVPLDKGFNEWFNYISSHPKLGIDSSNERGIYSSYKAGISSTFPFPDSLEVKMLFRYQIDTIDDNRRDTVSSIDIRAKFGNNKVAEKNAFKCYKELRKMLWKHYEVIHDANGSMASLFSSGKQNYPNCVLSRGYYAEQNFYFVMLSFDDHKYKKAIDIIFNEKH